MVLPAQSVQLIGSKTSPYTRRLRLLLESHPGTATEFKAINYLEIPADAQYLKSITPINKLPILIDGEKKVFESRIIAEYLTKKYRWPELSLDQENTLSMIDAANDVSINFFMLKKSGFDVDSSSYYMDRQRERLISLFNELATWAKRQSETNPADWNYVTMSLLSYIGWARFRKMADFSNHPELTEFVACFSKKPGVAETAIPGTQ